MLPKWNLADIQARMFNRPLMVTRERAEIALGVLGPRLNIGALVLGADAGAVSLDQLKARAAAARTEIDSMPGDDGLKKYSYDFATDSFAERDPYEVWNGLAIWPVRGTLMAENGIDPASGATGYDGLSFKCRHAAVNAAVKGAILDIDSGGGEVVDLMELCAQLRAFAAEKPLRAIIRGNGCSAAYALAACAGPGQVTAAPYSVVGSIGAIMMHADWSKNLEQEGIDVTLITSASHKADATPYAPLEADVGGKLKGMVDACASSFIDHVTEARETDRAGIEAQQAAFYSGQEALDLGLVDKFMSWDDSMKEFAQLVNGAGSRPAGTAPSGQRSAKGTGMSTEATAPAAENQPAFTKAQVDQATATARTEGVTAGTTAERERIAALAEIDAGTTLSPAFAEAMNAGTSAGDFAIGLARASKATAAAALQAAAADAANPATLPAGGAAAAAAAVEGQTVNRGQAYAAGKAARAKA